MSVKVSYKGYILEFEQAPTPEQIKASYEKIQTAATSSVNEKGCDGKNDRPSNRYPLSFTQKSLWLVSQVESESALYVISFAIHLNGTIDIEAFRSAFNSVIERHMPLHTCFEYQEGVPYQIVSPTFPRDIAIEQITVKTEYERNEVIRRLLLEQAEIPFNFEKAPLLRVKIIQFEKTDHIALITMHHIISDGQSVEIFIKDFGAFYSSYVNKRKADLEPLPIHYGDFVLSEQRKLQGEYIDELEAYWKDIFSGELPLLNIPKDTINALDRSYLSDMQILSFDPQFIEQVKEFGRKNGVSLFMILLAVFKILLYHYTGQEDIVVGTPVTTRTEKNTKQLIGCFINMLALKTSLWGNPTFKEILQRVKHTTSSAFQRQDYPFFRLVQAVNPVRDLSNHPIFQVVMSYQTNPFITMDLPGVTLTSFDISDVTCAYNLLLDVVEKGNGIDIRCQYRKDLFYADTIRRMLGHFNQLLRNIIIDPSQQLNRLDILTTEERKTILENFNNNIFVSQYHCIHQLFETQCEISSEKIAIQQNDQWLTYAELNKKANRLARYLREKGVKPDSIVGIMVERSLNMMVVILAVLKAGGAYLPIDPGFPQKRVEYILEDSDAGILITQRSLIDKVSYSGQIVFIEDESIFKADSTNLDNQNEVEDLAYLIYTSGSTGKPKGVMVDHKAVHNFFNGISEKIDFSSGKKILAVTTISFDIFVLETLLPLVKGMTVIISDEEEQRDPELLSQLIIKHHVDMLQLTPSRAQLLLVGDYKKEILACITEIMIGGEVFPENLLKNLKEASFKGKIYNLYGPTETTVWSCVMDLTNQDKIYIGKPLSNTNIFVLDDNHNVRPIGIPGEICIAGECLSRGYHKRPELTAEKFVFNPFCAGKLMYKTGDVGKWTPDGDIIFLGRIDNQVKVNGYRIELEEVENVLCENKFVKRCKAVVCDDNAGNKQLVVYVILDLVNLRTRNDSNFSTIEFIDFLKELLPLYMVPKYIVTVETFPETPNGKIDISKLPKPSEQWNVISSNYVAPRNDVESSIAVVFQEVLDIKQVGIYDNFFTLGGDSMKAVQVVTKLKQQGFDLQVKDLFKYSTIEHLGQHIKIGSPLMPENEIPLSRFQEQLLEQLNETKENGFSS